MNEGVVRSVMDRSGGRCEAMIQVGRTWARCGRGPVHIHHMLRRSHGGEILDAAGETYHLVVLCHIHHGQVHAGETDPDHGLLIEGNVYPGPIYVGPDPYLLSVYGGPSEHEDQAAGAEPLPQVR